MTTGIRTIIYPVGDLAKAKAVFEGLSGAAPHTDQPYYVGFRVDGQEIGLDPNGRQQGLTGAVAFWHVDDLDARVGKLQELGARVVQPTRSVGGGRRIAVLEDADGNMVGLLQDG